ncbi:MAG: zinc metallopeptidase [Eubacteriales bacterium]|nr:zinc metallopeptidase [Eubacteriales bacterium]
MFYDATFILVIIGLIITLIAQTKLKGTYAKYKNVRNESGITGAEAAKKILYANNIYDVQIQPVKGSLTDHYDPTKKTLNLSEDVYGVASVAAVGVAAHECGHAIQDAEEYGPLKFRSALVPVANIGSNISWYLILAGIFFGGSGSILCQIGIIAFALAVLFQLVTLPVEYNASNRAMKAITELGIVDGEEAKKSRAVLSAAALTYVAAAASSILQLLRLVILFGRKNDR